MALPTTLRPTQARRPSATPAIEPTITAAMIPALPVTASMLDCAMVSSVAGVTTARALGTTNSAAMTAPISAYLSLRMLLTSFQRVGLLATARSHRQEHDTD